MVWLKTQPLKSLHVPNQTYTACNQAAEKLGSLERGYLHLVFCGICLTLITLRRSNNENLFLISNKMTHFL